jgi:hypothetical protein
MERPLIFEIFELELPTFCLTADFSTSCTVHAPATNGTFWTCSKDQFNTMDTTTPHWLVMAATPFYTEDFDTHAWHDCQVKLTSERRITCSIYQLTLLHYQLSADLSITARYLPIDLGVQ